MLEKRIMFSSAHEEVSIEQITPGDAAVLEKVASGGLSIEIKKFIEDNIKSDPRYVYVLVSALGSGEVWGPNINGDYFEEADIVKSYKTFEEYGNVFMHHKNKDPKNAIGQILYAHWNPRMHRVELIVRIDRHKAPQIADDLDNGKMWDVSMGCKVKFDVCSICGNKAFTTKDYCECIRRHRGKVLPDGRQVYMRNLNPRFFDISFVYIGADRTAKSLLKIAYANVGLKKLSEIDKEIQGEIISKDAGHMASLLMKEFQTLKPYEENIPNEVLNTFATKNIPDILTSLMALGIVLKPHEFQRLALIKQGYDADAYERAGLFFDEKNIGGLTSSSSIDDQLPDLLNGNIDEVIIKAASAYMPERSALKHHLYPRLIKMAQLEKPKEKSPRRKILPQALAVPALVAAAIFYKRYLDQIPDFNATGFDRIIKDKPWLLPVILAGSAGTVKAIGARDRTNEKYDLEKNAGNLGGRIFMGVPAAYLASNIADKMDSDNKIIQFIAEHPNIVAMLGIAATNTKADWNAIKKALELIVNAKPFMNKEASVLIASSSYEENSADALAGLALKEFVKNAKEG